MIEHLKNLIKHNPLNKCMWLNIFLIVWIILMIIGGVHFSYNIAGGIPLVLFGMACQFVGFFVLLFSQRFVQVKRDEFNKLIDEKYDDIPHIQMSPKQGRYLMGWILVAMGLIWQMVGLFLPENGVMFMQTS